MIKFVFAFAMLMLADCSFAAGGDNHWITLVGARSGTLDQSSFSSFSIPFSSSAQTGYEAGLLYSYLFNSVVGLRSGVMAAQVAENYSWSQGNMALNATVGGTIFMIPVYVDINIGQYVGLLLGGYYWTTYGNPSCTNSITGNVTPGNCVWGQGAGFGPRLGFEVNFTPAIGMNLFYEPKVQVSSATSSSAAFVLNSYVADFVFKF